MIKVRFLLYNCKRRKPRFKKIAKSETKSKDISETYTITNQCITSKKEENLVEISKSLREWLYESMREYGSCGINSLKIYTKYLLVECFTSIKPKNKNRKKNINFINFGTFGYKLKCKSNEINCCQVSRKNSHWQFVFFVEELQSLAVHVQTNIRFFSGIFV